MTEQTEQDVFITSAGVHIPICAVSEATMKRAEIQVLAEARGRGEPVDALTYQVGQDEFEHDEDSIKDPKTTDAEREQWTEHKACLAVLNLEVRRRVYRIRLYKGILLNPDKAWLAEQAILGVYVPEDAVELKIAFLEDILITVDDWSGIMMAIARCALDGAGEEALSATEAMFQRAMGKLQRSVAERASAALQRQEGDVVTPPKAPDSDGDVQVGDPE